MATNYPGSIDSLTNPSAGDALTSPSHSAQHANANDAIEAIETELGVNPSGSDATVAARLTAIEAGTNLATGAVTSAKIADGTIATGDIADSAVTSAKIADGTITATDVAASTFAAFGTVGNLLTANQASGTDTLGNTTGFTAYNDCTIASSTTYAAAGSRSLAATATGSGVVIAGTSVATAPSVVGGDTYTASFAVRASASVYARVYIQWIEGGGLATLTPGPTFATSTSAWEYQSVTATAPAAATGAVVFLYVYGGSPAGTVFYLDKFSLHRGAAGTFALPGVPVTGQSHIATNGAVHLSGTGSPEGVVTAAPGSTWLQTDATTDVKGWIRWVKATGTGNTGWVAGPEADTGWRDVATDASGLTGSSITAQIRRTGATVAYRLSFAQSGAASGVTVVSAAGFRGTAPITYVPIYGNNAGAVVGAAEVGSATVKVYTTASGNGGTVSADVMYSTSDAWPSSLP